MGISIQLITNSERRVSLDRSSKPMLCYVYTLNMNIYVNFGIQEIRDSLVARITACRVVDRGSIPRRGVYFFSKKRYESRD